MGVPQPKNNIKLRHAIQLLMCSITYEKETYLTLKALAEKASGVVKVALNYVTNETAGHERTLNAILHHWFDVEVSDRNGDEYCSESMREGLVKLRNLRKEIEKSNVKEFDNSLMRHYLSILSGMESMYAEEVMNKELLETATLLVSSAMGSTDNPESKLSLLKELLLDISMDEEGHERILRETLKFVSANT